MCWRHSKLSIIKPSATGLPAEANIREIKDDHEELDYSWDSGFIRNGKDGSGIILTWNKAF